MRIEIRGRDFELTDALRHFTEKRLEVALDRFRDRIEMIEASLADLNGPRGGIDKQCRLRAHLAGGGDVIARADEADSHAAIVRAVHRLSDRVAHMFALRHSRSAVWG